MRFLTAMVSAAVAATVAVSGQQSAQLQPPGNATACSFYDLGMQKLKQENYAEALKDFDYVYGNCPSGEVKAEALLRAGQIYLANIPPALTEARNAAEVIVTRYGESRTAGSGFVLRGRVGLAERSPKGLLAALEDFARVSPTVFPGSDALPEALFYAGEANRLAGDFEQAIKRYRDVALRYPGSDWNARALLATANCYARSSQVDRIEHAMQALQRVRTDFAGTKEATLALNASTIIYRLYLKSQPFYAFTGRTVGGAARPFRDGVGVVIDSLGQILVADRDGIAAFGSNGSSVRAPAFSGAPWTIARSARGTLAMGREEAVTVDGTPGSLLLYVQPRSGPARPAQITAMATTWRGDWVIADARTKEVHRFGPTGAPIARLAIASAARLAVNGVDDIAVLDQETKDVKVFTRDGEFRTTIERRQPPRYELDSPVDIAFDPLDNLYVLDRGQAAVLVFDARMQFLRTFTIPAKAPGAFRKASALAVDAAGRLYILDEDAHAVLIYH